jgi:hypothetical protein
MAAAAHVCRSPERLRRLQSDTGVQPISSITNYLCHDSPFHWKSVP